MSEKIFITGASSGIGAALAIEFAKRGQPLASHPADREATEYCPAM
ncbi:MAG: hypothetical protein CM1200mP10_26920 [Candidatus Neomarinimicrobiota bacterium]|nr:MAG: hypothetical protein CM1200mP10_26920 [Candidatus Neomarinimicrobiota bacterium]